MFFYFFCRNFNSPFILSIYYCGNLDGNYKVFNEDIWELINYLELYGVIEITPNNILHMWPCNFWR